MQYLTKQSNTILVAGQFENQFFRGGSNLGMRFIFCPAKGDGRFSTNTKSEK
jgi:hypothetical protein